jgi:hypothetical protein
MVVAVGLRVAFAGCALLLTWLATHACAAQFVPTTALRTQLPTAAQATKLPAVTTLSYGSARALDTRTLSPRARPWLLAMASTTLMFAAGYATSEGLGYGANATRRSALERSRDLELDLDARLRAEGQATRAEERADLFDKISDICLAGSVAASGATLLIWLTSKARRADRQNAKVLLGPMVLRGVSGGGLVLREKF